MFYMFDYFCYIIYHICFISFRYVLGYKHIYCLFRWVCTSGNPLDLAETDKIAAETMEGILNKGDCKLSNDAQNFCLLCLFPKKTNLFCSEPCHL